MIVAAARDVDRPIFYSVAVIIAGYLPIYALHGPSGKLFHPMADTMSFALLGALILTLTLVPVLASYWFKGGVREKENKTFRVDQEHLRRRTPLVPEPPEADHAGGHGDLWRHPAAGSLHRRRIHAAPRRGRALGAGHHALHDFV